MNKILIYLNNTLKQSFPFFVCFLILFTGFHFFYQYLTYDKMQIILIFILFLSFVWCIYNKELNIWKKKIIKNIIGKNVSQKTPFFLEFLFALAIIMNLSILFETWNKGIGHPYFTIGGFLPYSDTEAYCAGAKNLIEFGILDEWNSLRRPLPICFYAVILKLFGQNIQTTILVTVLIVSISIYHSAKIIYQSFGSFASILMIYLLSCFYSLFNGTMLTEPIGLIFGNYAFVFLFSGLNEQKRGRFLFGLFCIALALSIRAGAFFILPILILYSIFRFRKNMRMNFMIGIAGIACVILVMVLNSMMLKFVGSTGKGLQISNFSYTLYGIVKGGKGWTYIYQDHPELRSLPESEQYKKAYDYAIQELKKNPKPFISAIGKVLVQTIFNIHIFTIPFDFIVNNYLLVVPFIMIFLALFIIKEPEIHNICLFFIISMAGIVLSAPFLVDGGYRVYAATMPINCALVSTGAGILLKFINFKKNQVKLSIDKRSNNPGLHLHVIIILLFLLFIGPLIIKLTIDENLTNNIQGKCKSRLVFRNKNIACLHIVNDSCNTKYPEIRYSAYHKNNPSVFLKNHVFRLVRERDYLVGVFDLCTKKWYHVVFKEDVRKLRSKFVNAEVTLIGGNRYHSLYFGKIISDDNR